MPSITEQRRIAAIANEVLSLTVKAQEASNAMLLDVARLPSQLLAKAFDSAGA